MGIGNTATAVTLISITGFSSEDCIGNGTGVNEQQFYKKTNNLKKARKLQRFARSRLVTYLVGFEILQMAGGMLEVIKIT
jgi:nicotinate-nucleotide--dimethylbenzimidazole phosphoribosyltransferase